MKFFKSSKAIIRGCGSKFTLRNKTLGLHFQISFNSTYFLEISCLTRTGPGIKNCFCLHGIFTTNVSFGKFFKCFWFFAFGIWKNEGFTFLICCLLVINIYCFFDLLLFRWSWYMATARGIFLMICSSVWDFWRVGFMLFCSSHLTYKKI